MKWLSGNRTRKGFISWKFYSSLLCRMNNCLRCAEYVASRETPALSLLAIHSHFHIVWYLDCFPLIMLIVKIIVCLWDLISICMVIVHYYGLSVSNHIRSHSYPPLSPSNNIRSHSHPCVFLSNNIRSHSHPFVSLSYNIRSHSHPCVSLSNNIRSHTHPCVFLSNNIQGSHRSGKGQQKKTIL